MRSVVVSRDAITLLAPLVRMWSPRLRWKAIKQRHTVKEKTNLLPW